MATWPERWLRIALAWIDEQWNTPSKTEWYLMRIAQRIHQGQAKDPNTVLLENEKIVFKKQVRPTTEEDKKALMQKRVSWSKAAWIGGVKASKQTLHSRGKDGH